MSSKDSLEALLDPSVHLSIFNNMADGVCVSTDGVIQFMNRYLTERFGDGTGKHRNEFLGNQQEKCENCRNDGSDKDGVSRYEWYSPKTRQTFDVINSPFMNRNGTVSILSIFRDISEQKRLHKRLEGYYGRLKEANKELKIVNKTISSANQKLEELSTKDEL
ncbi:hypothetical protein JXL19_02460, partial [bacterium]|nr:hypothetical protein [bacterium]